MHSIRILLLFPVDWIIDYEPAWLGPAIMSLGLLLIISWYIIHISGEHTMTTTVALIAVLGAAPWAVQNRQIVVAILSVIGSWFQGIGIVRGYLKIKHYFYLAAQKVVEYTKKTVSSLSAYGGSQPITQNENLNKGNQDVMKSAVEWLVFQLLGLLVIIMSVWIGFGLSIVGDLTIPSLTNGVIISWTLLTTFGAILGLGWRFWSVRESFPATVLLGLILLASGAEIYNIRALGGEVIVFLISKFVFALGFLGAISILVLTRQSSKIV